MVPAPVVAIALVPLVLWRMYSRIKRLTSRQRSRTWRHRTTLVFFPLLLLMIVLAALPNPLVLLGLAAGIAGGVALGMAGVRKTTFEQVGDEYYFTPHAYIGMLVAGLFLSRMAWRAWQVYTMNDWAQHDFVRSPLTLAVFGILAGYYITYATGLLRWRKRTAPSNQAA
jgi:cytochrome b561